MDEVYLKPCPVCGRAPAIKHWRRRGDWYRISCIGDGLGVHPYFFTSDFRTLEEAAEVWNRRTDQ